jgi:hypothetical protein
MAKIKYSRNITLIFLEFEFKFEIYYNSEANKIE